jgi:hypothetical protein
LHVPAIAVSFSTSEHRKQMTWLRHSAKGEIMRVATLGAGLLLFSTAANAQTPCTPGAAAYDPYKPSHIAIMRDFGGTVVAQAPISSLLQLDPYVPSQGELLRQAGRGIPLWTAYPWYAPPPVVAVRECGERDDASAAAMPATSPARAPLTRFADVLAALPADRATPGAAASPAARPASERTQGVSIQYAGRTWVSAGRALAFRDGEFVRAGESAGVAVYRRPSDKDNVIYIASIQGMVAPFRAAR